METIGDKVIVSTRYFPKGLPGTIVGYVVKLDERYFKAGEWAHLPDVEIDHVVTGTDSKHIKSGVIMPTETCTPTKLEKL